jgi:hypothetical protein
MATDVYWVGEPDVLSPPPQDASMAPSPNTTQVKRRRKDVNSERIEASSNGCVAAYQRGVIVAVV